jgi:hypothetical protein
VILVPKHWYIPHWSTFCQNLLHSSTTAINNQSWIEVQLTTWKKTNVNKTCVLLQTSYFLRKHRIEFEQTTWEAYTIYTLLSSFLYLRLKKVLLLCAVFVFFQVVSWTSIQLWLLIAVVLECRRFWQNVLRNQMTRHHAYISNQSCIVGFCESTIITSLINVNYQFENNI